MWQVENWTPFATDRSWVRDRDGAEVWLVAVRCTFLVRPDGTTVVADEQAPPVLAPKYRGEPAATSLQFDSDFYLTKPTTDVLLLGHAYAPGGKPTTAVDVTMQVADVRKTLRVTGDRPYQKTAFGLTAGAAQPFSRMPLTYERAYGGAEPNPPKNPDRPRFEERNPVGTGFAPTEGKSAPNVEYPGLNLGSRPAGFGPIGSHWQPRANYAGTYDERWKKERHPLYPTDLDDRFFLCSPEDQRPKEFLRGGELVELTNLTPGGRLAFVLPRVAFGFETVLRNGERLQHRGALHSVTLEPDVPRVVLVWRTSLRCHAKVHSLLGTVVRQKRIINPTPGQSIPSGAWEDGSPS
jgi:hypothetical protein